MTILHIDSSISGDTSVSRRLSAAAIAKITAAQPSETVVYRDLVAAPLDHYIMTDKPGNDTEGAAFSATILDEFLAAGTIVIGAPLYNFTISSQLKAWIDRIVITGVTFKFGENGPVGLMGGKRVIVIVSRGLVYQPGTSSAALEHAETLLDGIFGFIGIKPEVIIAEGLIYGPDARAGSIAGAEAAIANIPALAA